MSRLRGAVAGVLVTMAFAGPFVLPGRVQARPAASHGSSAHNGGPARAVPAGALGAQTPDELLGATSGEGDFLGDNGLVSPGCGQAPGATSAGCTGSGFLAAPDPTSNYAFDVHINTGFNIGNDVAAESEDMLQWAWMALVAMVRGLIVMLEWCYAMNLFGAAILSRISGALRDVEATLTAPLLACALAVAAALTAYHGLVRRRVSQTLGQAVVTVAMMVAGLWATLDPGGSVGALAAWVNEASAGALAVVTTGTPQRANQSLAASMHGLFGDVVTAPWCYMEFGNVEWCQQPRRLDPRLRGAARAIAAQERSDAASQATAYGDPTSLLQSAALLDGAQTNGALFLALPANGPARNSINTQGSLLRVLCGGSYEVTNCDGPTAAQAGFRTEHEAWARAVGLVLIWIGVLGMLLLLGWIGMRLLAAAILGLLCLLLAPAAVIAPALGDGGRGVFTAWGARLLGAVTAKLIYSLLLGAVLLTLQVLMGLALFGWWVQWCLISSLWWIVFLRRHELLSLARVGERTPWARGTAATGALSRRAGLLGRVGSRAGYHLTDAGLLGAGRWARDRALRPPLTAQRRQQIARYTRQRAREGADRQAGAALQREHAVAEALVAGTVDRRAGISAMQTRLARVRAAQAATADGESGVAADVTANVGSQRRRLRLEARAQRLQARIASEQAALTGAQQTVYAAARSQAHSGRVFTDEQLSERGRLYDAQAALANKGRPDAEGRRRDYRRLASLVGLGEREWDALRGRERLETILRIDDELALRSARHQAGERAVAARERPLPRAERRKLDRAYDHAQQQSVRGRGHRPPARPTASPLMRWVAEERHNAAAGTTPATLAERARGQTGAAAPAPPGSSTSAAERRRRQFRAR